MIKKILYIGLLSSLLIIGTLGTYFYSIFNKTYNGPDVTFTVQTGDTFGKVNQRLYEAGLIPDKRLFHYYARHKNILTKLRAGDFTILSGSNLIKVLDTLIYGQPNLKSVTVPEGKNMYEIAKLISTAGITNEKDFLEATQNRQIISELNIDAINLEGYLYPETYRFAAQTSGKEVVVAMVELFKNRTRHLDFNHPFLNKHQIIILASMVEKETGAKFERPAIAGVFTNRLKKKMRLESDPTTIYGIWERYKGNIKKSDLLEITPYNTYKIPALPIGPIANPSLEAIKAVLNPESHEYLFFVSRNDGTHVFTKKYSDHSRAVNDFQKNSKARQGKSWRDLKQ